MNTLPGFFPPDAPNATNRIEAFADGSVETTLLRNEAGNADFSGYTAKLVRKIGLSQVLVLDQSQTADCLLVADAPGGLKDLKFLLRANQVSLRAGTYELQLIHSGRIVLTRSLTVPPRL